MRRWGTLDILDGRQQETSAHGELGISVRFHVCPPWFAPQFSMVSSTNVQAVAANNVALQHYGQKVFHWHVMTNSGTRILIQITFDVMNVRKPLLSSSALKHRGVTIIFNHDYDRIIFRNETVNLVSRDCHSYLHITLANGIHLAKRWWWLERMRQTTWMRKSTATMVPRDLRLKKLQLVIDEQSPMRIKPDSLKFLVKRKLQEYYVLLKHPQTLRGWHTTPHTFHSEIGALSVLRVGDEVLRTDELWWTRRDGLHVHSNGGREQNSAMHYIRGNAQWSGDQLHVRPERWLWGLDEGNPATFWSLRYPQSSDHSMWQRDEYHWRV